MNETLSKYKWKKIAEESLKNCLRLHTDSIILYENSSYPSAFQLSVLAIEEFSKAQWVDHYYYSSVTNEGFPGHKDEQDFLNLLYNHKKKQFNFIVREIFDYSPNFIELIRKGNLDSKKQNATYVGLKKGPKNKVITDGRISIPTTAIKKIDAKQIISLMNHELLDIHKKTIENEGYWGIWELDSVLNEDSCQIIFCWPHKTGLKSRKWSKINIKNNS